MFPSTVGALVFLATLPSLANSGKLLPKLENIGVKFEWHDGAVKRAIPDIDEAELTEANFYDLPIHTRTKRALQYRSGSTTETHSCNNIRAVPSYLRTSSGIQPNGLDYFYQKYTEAYGIPVISSNALPDSALMRACYVTRFLFADHSGVRQWYYKNNGRIAVMAVSENTTDIPEHSSLDPKWDWRARGLGATEGMPICTGAEENVMCYEKDRYGKEDILLHEMAHGVHWLGAKYAISDFNDRLKTAYTVAKEAGLWNKTYAMSTFREYFAEGSQSYFNCNNYADPPNGIHNHVNTREKLQEYDSVLYKLVKEIFPCGNSYLKRCESTRAEENAQQLKMNCNAQHITEESPKPDATPLCTDNKLACRWWASKGECSKNPGYMLVNCKKSCNIC